jgi:hypothetical protein
VAESRLTLSTLSDDDLGRALRDLSAAVAFPTASGGGAVASGAVALGAVAAGTSDLAERARRRIELAPPRRTWQQLGWPFGRSGIDRSGASHTRPLQRGLVLALVALLVIAAVAGAVGLGLPGLRIIFGDGPSSGPTASLSSPGPSSQAPSSHAPSASISPLGASIALGTAVSLDEVERISGLTLLLPTDPDLGPPDATYINGRRAALVWATRPGLPETESAGVGLVISEFSGEMDDGYFQKVLGEGNTLTKVTVAGAQGWWISGSSHFFYYVDGQGKYQNDDHRIVGDVLLWSAGDVTYRLESGLGRAGAIAVAESLR